MAAGAGPVAMLGSVKVPGKYKTDTSAITGMCMQKDGWTDRWADGRTGGETDTIHSHE